MFKEALNCYSAGCFKAFGAMSRRTAQSLFRELGERGKLELFDTLQQIRALAELDDETFARTVAEAEVPVFVDFYADWCGPCKVMAPAVDALAAKYTGKAIIANRTWFRDLQAFTLQGWFKTDGAQSMHFDIDPFRKYCLINGLDEIGLTLRHAEKIRVFEARRQTLFPWYF